MTMQVDLDKDGIVKLQGCESHDGVDPTDDDVMVCIDLNVFNGLSVGEFLRIQKSTINDARPYWLKCAQDVCDRYVKPGKYQPTKQNIPQSFRMAVFERDNFTCKHCGSRNNLSVDHIIPESRGGQLTMENAQTLCKTCNCRKGNR